MFMRHDSMLLGFVPNAEWKLCLQAAEPKVEWKSTAQQVAAFPLRSQIKTQETRQTAPQLASPKVKNTMIRCEDTLYWQTCADY